MDRKYANLQIMPGDSYSSERRLIRYTDKEHANVITSVVQSQPSLHAPCLDIDLPCRLMESKTPGHYHLYIDHLLPWEEYKQLLEVLVGVGLIERGWYDRAVKDRASVLLFGDERFPIDRIVDELDRIIDGS